MPGLPDLEGFTDMITKRFELAFLGDHQPDMQRVRPHRSGGDEQSHEKRQG
ncbi:hypothetical protein OEG86_17235 [Hoeflea alexandrii]|uniref:hypothetical protein n=1 Tax=Hoeflea alexandrii TaxID=288436 RepID=UPI00226FC32A|nr:hypothetical protein [Hoeflea alexandrii]MCY0153678.1 hypothetical protein [Hoeflea alexandrii]